MIHVDAKPEPPHFALSVRKPGRNFLHSCRGPITSKQWQLHSYWRNILPDLHKLYNGICAYSCEYIPTITGVDTVEHFLAKASHPKQAYEWTNYRLVCLRMNSRKRIKQIIDPFDVENGWFELDFPSLQVKPNAALIPRDKLALALDTIEILGLNREDSIISRERWVKDYCTGNVSAAFLFRNAPFIYMELDRQSLLGTINTIMIFT